MSFFGVVVEPSKPTPVAFPSGANGLRLTLMALPDNVKGKSTLYLSVDGEFFAIGTLSSTTPHQMALDCFLDAKTPVELIAKGDVPIHVTGYSEHLDVEGLQPEEEGEEASEEENHPRQDGMHRAHTTVDGPSGTSTTGETTAMSRADSDGVLHNAEPGMGPRSHTFSEGVSFSRRLDTYSGEDDASWVPSGYRKSYLEEPLKKHEEVMAKMAFEEWRAVDRSKIPGWRCSVRKPVTFDELPPIFKTDGPESKIRVYQGAVTDMAVDAIVNAANEGCMGGGGVDGAVHDAAGPLLMRECASFPGCETGQTRITKGYLLPAKFILHTVGPRGQYPLQLKSAYETCFALARRHGLRTIAFCCISTGIFGYPLDAATKVAIEVALRVLRSDAGSDIDGVVFACFRREEASMYQKLLPKFVAGELTVEYGGSRRSTGGAAGRQRQSDANKKDDPDCCSTL